MAWPIWLPFLILPDEAPRRATLSDPGQDPQATAVAAALSRCRELVANTSYDSLFDDRTHALLLNQLRAVMVRRAALRGAFLDLTPSGPTTGQATQETTARLRHLLQSDDAELAELLEQAERLHAELLFARFGRTSGAQEVVDELSARVAGLEAVVSRTP